MLFPDPELADPKLAGECGRVEHHHSASVLNDFDRAAEVCRTRLGTARDVISRASWIRCIFSIVPIGAGPVRNRLLAKGSERERLGGSLPRLSRLPRPATLPLRGSADPKSGEVRLPVGC